ncbi:hypothetical protein D0Z00_000202 [Geotrichum galactomycetum]|uniref:Uncharacterized protein n=1 Tax=Geotrichum galactomycetum TaxID=27317 RepID=A0ACB6VA92_9ASCO|nr:hypothetical protein D0Z00_000202 [Geotrichum candidum]
MSANQPTSATVSTLALTPSTTTTTTTTTTPTRPTTTTSIDSSVSTASTVADSREQMFKPASKPAPAAPVSTLTPIKTEAGAVSTHSAPSPHSASEDHKKRAAPIATGAAAEQPAAKKIKSEHSGLAKHQIKFALASLRAVKRLRDASPFLVPVDIVRFNIPTYFDYVKKPMDLSTMERKVSAGTYRSADDFFADMDLIVSNCVLFNGPQAEISQMARNMKASFDKHMRNMPPFEAPPPPPPKPKRKSFTSSTLPKSQRVTSGITPKPVHSTSIPHASATFSSSSNTTNNNNTNHHPNSIGSADAASKPFALHPSGMPMIRRDSAIDGRPKREIHPTRPKDVPYSDVKPRRKKYAAELKFCGSVLKELMSKRHETFSFPFLEPVDPVALNCPDYFKIIKEPMDLSTISTKYNTNHYENAHEFEADVRLMLRNCYKFNPEGSPVNLMGHRLEALFDKKWADKPVTPATPPPQSVPSGLISSASAGFSDSDYDSEDQQAIAANTTIKFLEEQLLRMQQELDKMKRETVRESRERRAKLQPHTAAHKKPKPAAAKKPTTGSSGSANNGSSKPGGSAADGAPKKKAPVRRRSNTTSAKPAPNGKPVEVTYEMKKELSEAIGTLPEKKMIHVLTVIQESMPQLRNTDQEEIELDMDTLDPATLWKLYTYVVAPKAASSAVTASSAGTAAATGEPDTNGNSSSAAADYKHQQHSKKKTKPLSDAEQSRQIEQIQKKIEQFERAESGTPHSAAAAIADISSSSDEDDDDDDDDDSSSEEE